MRISGAKQWRTAPLFRVRLHARVRAHGLFASNEAVETKSFVGKRYTNTHPFDDIDKPPTTRKEQRQLDSLATR
jgi:hypothetical protein